MRVSIWSLAEGEQKTDIKVFAPPEVLKVLNDALQARSELHGRFGFLLWKEEQEAAPPLPGRETPWDTEGWHLNRTRKVSIGDDKWLTIVFRQKGLTSTDEVTEDFPLLEDTIELFELIEDTCEVQS